jgi:hypothetical protein
MSSNDATSNTFEEIRKECTTLEKPSSSMCKDLDIKIAIIKRAANLFSSEPPDIIKLAKIRSTAETILGAYISTDLVIYTVNNEIASIHRNIANEVPIALELDNLKPNWG